MLNMILKKVQMKLRNIVFKVEKCRIWSWEMSNLKLKNVCSKLRNVYLKLRNVCWEMSILSRETTIWRRETSIWNWEMPIWSWEMSIWSWEMSEMIMRNSAIDPSGPS